MNRANTIEIIIPNIIYLILLFFNNSFNILFIDKLIISPDTNKSMYDNNNSLITLFKNRYESRAPIGSDNPLKSVFLITLPLLSPE